MLHRVLFQYEELGELAWSRLSDGAGSPSHPMHMVVLATTGRDGGPSLQRVILTCAERRTGSLWFCTDRRSAEVEQVVRRPAACVLAYDSREGVVIRASGAAAVHVGDAAAAAYWKRADAVLRGRCCSAEGPGASRPVKDARLHSPVPCGGDWERGRGNFAVIRVSVETMDWLQALGPIARRAVLRADRGWAASPVTP